jgi:hypothetical protein
MQIPYLKGWFLFPTCVKRILSALQVFNSILNCGHASKVGSDYISFLCDMILNTLYLKWRSNETTNAEKKEKKKKRKE